MFGMSFNDIQALKRRNYPRNTNYMNDSDQFLFDEIERLHPEGRLLEFKWFAIYVITCFDPGTAYPKAWSCFISSSSSTGEDVGTGGMVVLNPDSNVKSCSLFFICPVAL